MSNIKPITQLYKEEDSEYDYATQKHYNITRFWIKFSSRIDKSKGNQFWTFDTKNKQWTREEHTLSKKLAEHEWVACKPLNFVLENGMGIESAVLRFARGVPIGVGQNYAFGHLGNDFDEKECLRHIRNFFVDNIHNGISLMDYDQ